MKLHDAHFSMHAIASVAHGLRLGASSPCRQCAAPGAGFDVDAPHLHPMVIAAILDMIVLTALDHSYEPAQQWGAHPKTLQLSGEFVASQRASRFCAMLRRRSIV